MRWDGIANGDEFTVAQKQKARRDQDIPEDNQRKFSMIVGLPPGELSSVWHTGLIDIATRPDGQGEICMTKQQSATWKAIR